MNFKTACWVILCALLQALAYLSQNFAVHFFVALYISFATIVFNTTQGKEATTLKSMASNLQQVVAIIHRNRTILVFVCFMLSVAVALGISTLQIR